MNLDFLKLRGRFVLCFLGECTEAFIYDTPEQVVEKLCAIDGAGWLEYSSLDCLFEILSNEENWMLDSNYSPFRCRFDLDEINSVQIFVNVADEQSATQGKDAT